MPMPRSRPRGRGHTLYYGATDAGTVCQKMTAHNFDFGGFIPLLGQVYDAMIHVDPEVYLDIKLPYCIFQHVMVEILNAYLMHIAIFSLRKRIPQLEYSHPLKEIGADNCGIPRPIYEYICGIGSNIAATGVEVYCNIPDIAIPKSSYEGCRSGTFGQVNAETHNAYECYISPYITSEYIIRTALNKDGSKTGEWSPFPEEWVPEACIPTQNLLGYSPIDSKLHFDTLNLLKKCHFENSDSITGRLCHSFEAMRRCSSVMERVRGVEIVKADFRERKNDAAFIFNQCDLKKRADKTLFDAEATLYSPFAVDASAFNQAKRFAFKRKRTLGAPGTCFVKQEDCSAPDGWLDTINDNFFCTGPFGLAPGFSDYKILREPVHYSWANLPILSISSWMKSIYP